MAGIPRFRSSWIAGVHAFAAGGDHVRLVCRCPSQLKMGLHVDDPVDARYFRADLCAGTDTRPDLLPDTVLVSAGAMGWICDRQCRTSGSDSFGDLHGV